MQESRMLSFGWILNLGFDKSFGQILDILKAVQNLFKN